MSPVNKFRFESVLIHCREHVIIINVMNVFSWVFWRETGLEEGLTRWYTTFHVRGIQDFQIGGGGHNRVCARSARHESEARSPLRPRSRARSRALEALAFSLGFKLLNALSYYLSLILKYSDTKRSGKRRKKIYIIVVQTLRGAAPPLSATTWREHSGAVVRALDLQSEVVGSNPTRCVCP